MEDLGIPKTDSYFEETMYKAYKVDDRLESVRS
jgi:hypothetical protein